MQRIDFLGASGVGKSTLYSLLAKKLKETSRYYTVAKARKAIAVELLKSASKRPATILYQAILGNAVLTCFDKKVSAKTTAALYKTTVWDNRSKYNNIINTVLDYPHVEEDPMLQLMRIKWFYEVLNDVIFLENTRLPGVVLFDESLAQKANVALGSKSNAECRQAVEAYFHNLPKPFALVYCYLDKEDLLARISMRRSRKIAFAHKNKNKEALEGMVSRQLMMAETGANLLAEKGVPVKRIDLSLSPETNTEDLLGWLKVLHAQDIGF